MGIMNRMPIDNASAITRELRRSLEGLVSQINPPHRHIGAPGIFSDLLMSLPDAKERVGSEKQRKATPPIYP